MIPRIIIGNGSFSEVSLISTPGRLIARKEFKHFEHAEKYFMREIDNLLNLSRYGFVRMIEANMNNGNHYVDMDFIPSGALSKMIKYTRDQVSIEGYDTAQEIIIAYGVATVMSWMHKDNRIHRDLKPDNILLDHLLNPHIGDFGLSRKLADNMTCAGTRNYSSPEISLNMPHITTRSDVYMFGMTLYAIIELQHPFNGCSDEIISLKLRNCEKPKFSEDGNRHLLSPVMRRCIEFKPENRPSMEEAAAMIASIAEKNKENIEFSRFKEYADYLAKIDQNNPQLFGTPKNLIAAANRGTPFAIELVKKLRDYHYFNDSDDEMVQSAINGESSDDDEEDEEEDVEI